MRLTITFSIMVLSAVVAAFAYLVVVRQDVALKSHEQIPKTRIGVIDGDFEYACRDCNVLVLALTNVRRDAVGVYNNQNVAVTPNLNRLAERSLVFDRMYSPASWTLPVSASIMTSLYPLDHLLLRRDAGLIQGKSFSRLEDSVPNIVSLLKEADFSTGGFTGNFDYRTIFGVTDDFDHFFLPPELQATHESGEVIYSIKKQGERVYGNLGPSISDFKSWNEEHSDQKWFAYVQGFDAHCPFGVPEANIDFVSRHSDRIQDFQDYCFWNFETQEPIKTESGEELYFLDNNKGSQSEVISQSDTQLLRELYLGEVGLVDSYVGDVWEYLEQNGQIEKTVIVVLSEHGDVIGEHGRFMRGGPLTGTFYDEVLHVPFMIYHPALESQYGGMRFEHVTSLIDVAPTVLDVLGLESPDSFRGGSLFELIQNIIPERKEVWAMSMFLPLHTGSAHEDVSLALARFTHEDSVILNSEILVPKTNFNFLEPKIPQDSQVIDYAGSLSLDTFIDTIEFSHKEHTESEYRTIQSLEEPDESYILQTLEETNFFQQINQK